MASSSDRNNAGSNSSRRLLLVSYHFPPDRAVGAKRWEKLSQYAVQRRWGVDVFMRGEPEQGSSANSSDDSIRVHRIPAPPLRIERFENAVWSTLKRLKPRPSLRPAGDAQAARAAPQSAPSIARSDVEWSLLSPRGWMRAYWASLEFARVSAWGDAVQRAAAAVHQPGVHRGVITSGPPFMSHDAGRRISEQLGLPFVMDMRDPWSHVERLAEAVASPMWLRLASRNEARAVRRASLVVTNTDVARAQMASTYPEKASDIITVMNGADEDPLPEPRRTRRFVIAHAGTIYLDRDPRALFVAAARVIRELALTPDDITLEFIGEMEAVGGFPIEETARSEGISEYVRLGPLRPHREAMEFMAAATMLVTMSGSNMAAIPAKTFECVRFPAWILALSAPGSATDLLLRGTDADVASPSDADGIAAIIRRRYLEYREGMMPEPIGAERRFSREHQAELLFDALEQRIL